MPLTAYNNELSFEENLLIATAENNIDLLSYCIDNFPPEEKQIAVNNALYQASYSSTTTVATIRYLIDNGADVKFDPYPDNNYEKLSLLRIIITKKSVADKIELVNLWIDNGENINKAKSSGNILCFFQSWEDETLRNFLLSKGADPTVRDEDGKSGYTKLLKEAARNNRIDLIDYAITKINPDERALAINEAFNSCCSYKDTTTATIKYLINKGADISFVPIGGSSSLHAVVTKNKAGIEQKIELVKLLLAEKLDVNILDTNGQNIMFQGPAWIEEDLRDLLLNNGANPFITDKEGNSILTCYRFVDSILPSIILFIKNLGIDLDHTNIEGCSVLNALSLYVDFPPPLAGFSSHLRLQIRKDTYSCIKLLLESGITKIHGSLSNPFTFDRPHLLSNGQVLNELFKLTKFIEQIYKTEIKDSAANAYFIPEDFPAKYHDFIFKRLTSLFIKLYVPADFVKYVNEKLSYLPPEFKAGLLFAHKTAYYVNKIYDLEEPEFNGLSLEEQRTALTSEEKEQIIKLLKEKITIEGVPTKDSLNEMFYNNIKEDADDLTKFIAGSFVEEMHKELVDSIEVFLATYLHLIDNENFPSPAPYSLLKPIYAKDAAGASAEVIKTLQSYEDKLKGGNIIKFFNSLISRSSFELTSIDETNVETYKHLNILIKQINANLLMPKQTQTHLKEIQKACNLAVIKYEVNVLNILDDTHADSAVLDESEDASDDDNAADVTEASSGAEAEASTISHFHAGAAEEDIIMTGVVPEAHT